MKYSILLPCYNGHAYLRSCIESVIIQDFNDFELLISDDSSTDNTWSFLESLDDPRIHIFRHEKRTSMAEHWEWLLSKAKGEWIIFLGQDDGLQPYFFHLSERLTQFAESKNISAIASERAYFFWPGCENTYGDIKVNFSAKSVIQVLDSKKQLFKTIRGENNYFLLPQMYTTSLVKYSLIKTIIDSQNGVFFRTHPQDANIAAAVCLYTKHYIWSGIPLGWVGTSPKSAGMAISFNKEKKLDDLRQDYVSTITDSNLHLNARIGPFSFGSTALYFWGALLEVSSLNMKCLNKLFSSALVTRILFLSVYREMKDRIQTNIEIKTQYMSILHLNRVFFFEILVYDFFSFLCSTIRKVINRFFRFFYNRLHILNNDKEKVASVSYISTEEQSMNYASNKSFDLYQSLI